MTHQKILQKNNNKESSEDKTHVPSKPRKKHINNTQDSNISNESDTKETIQTLSDIINPEIEKVILGKCSFENLPPLPKKVVRIFISSTFTGKFIYYMTVDDNTYYPCDNIMVSHS